MKRGFIKIFIRIKNIGFYVKWYYSVIDLIICKKKFIILIDVKTSKKINSLRFCFNILLV